MGVVYKARQTKLDRLVALKMILAGGHAGQADLTRFITEAEAVARLQHANVVLIYEVGEHGGLPYFSLEFCPGGSLDRKFAGTPLPPREAAALAETLARAMQAAHAKGVIHRDLKPANVLLAEDGTPKITDFGLAKKLDASARHTASGAIMGSPSYMAPEQASARKNEVGPATDVWGLGAILYELLTGRPPFHADTFVDAIFRVLHDDVVPPSRLRPKVVPPGLESICLRCLEKDPARRYQTAEELAEDLGRWLRGEPVVAHKGSLSYTCQAFLRRHRRGVGAAAVLVALLLLGTGVGLVYRSERERNRQLEEMLQKRGAEAAPSVPTRAQSETPRDLLLSDEQIYKRLIKSTALIIVPVPGGFSMGTGFVIDKVKRLVLTNDHVAGDNTKAFVFFPTYDKNGLLIADRDHFLSQIKANEALTGKVVASDPRADLALMQLEMMPDGLDALPIASDYPGPGAHIVSLGHPNGLLWVLAVGTVHQFLHKHWKTAEQGHVVERDAYVMLTNAPVNPGDSGGPVVNDRGQVVAVQQGTFPDNPPLNLVIDLTELRSFLERNGRLRGQVLGAQPAP
jgi:S1-C subfamily serine protease/tRNA A-37 threonylcarbamoyl transferase component Bud32